MTEPSPPRAVPGPPRPGPGPADADDASGDDALSPGAADLRPTFNDLDGRPVAEHVTVFEDEHTRLRRELGTIDQL